MFRNILILLSFCFFMECGAIEPICSPTQCYQVVEELGEGAFGKVYAVTDSNGEKFAIKWYKKKFEDFDDFWWNQLGDMEREFEMGKTFDHPNIIKSYDLFSGQTDEDHYLLLELVEGQTVIEIPKKLLSREEAINASRQLVEALHYTMDLGYVYFDLHTSNIMITHSSDLKVIDLASFFSFDEIWNHITKKTKGPGNRKLQKFFEENPELLKSRYVKGSGFDHFKVNFFMNNFNRLTDTCIDIIKKSDMDQEEKIELFAEIKKLAWRLEDEEIDPALIDIYLDRLHFAIS